MDMGINYLAVLVAAVANMAIGMAWYSQALFGKPWLELMGWSEKDVAANKAKGMGPTFLLAFLSTLVTAGVLAKLMFLVGVSSMQEAIVLGLWMWLGFVVTSMISLSLWEQRKWGLFWITVTNSLVVVMVDVAILFNWQ